MKSLLLSLALLIFAYNYCLAQEQVAFTPPPSVQKKMVDRSEKSTDELLKKEGFYEQKSFAVNRFQDTIMYVEFISNKGNKYTIATIFASWQLSDDGKEGFIEIYKDSPFEGYPTLYYTLADQPHFYTQAKTR